MTEGIELPNQEKSERSEKKETYKYLGIMEADTIKHAEKKEKNLIKGINAWTVPHVRYSGPFLKWTRNNTDNTNIKWTKENIKQNGKENNCKDISITNKRILIQENLDIAKGNFNRETETLQIAAQNNIS